MKQTYSVNIGGRAYNIDHDAYRLLDRYLDDIASRLNVSDTDSMGDIESRIADIFDETITSPMQVINIELVRRAMAVIGRPEMFGAQKRGFSYQEDPAYSYGPKRLYRSTDNKVLGGICGGLGEYFDIDPNLIRVVATVLLFITFFTASIVYIILWIALPKRPDYVKSDEGQGRR